MSSDNWPLMVFTLCMQFSAGVILFYNLFILTPVARKNEKIPMRFQAIVLIAVLSAVTGGLFSFLHLGTIGNAFKSVANLSESWLSREILAVVIYTGLLLLYASLQYLFRVTVRPYKLLLDLTSILGLIMVYIMGQVYKLPSMPAWNSIFTSTGFFLALLLSGSSLVLLFQLKSGSWASQKGLTLLIISVPVVQIVLLPVHMSWLSSAGAAGRESLTLLLNDYLAAFSLRLVFEILTLAFGFWAFFSIKSDTLKASRLFIPALLAFISAIVSLVLDRFLFYSQIVPLTGL